MKLFPLAAAASLLLLSVGCSDDKSTDRASDTPDATTETTAATLGQSPEEVAKRFLLAFSSQDAPGLCDVVLEDGAPFPADERDACIERFELDFAPAHAHDEGDEDVEDHAEDHGGSDGQVDEQLSALRTSAEKGPLSISDESAGVVEVTYPLDENPLVVTLQKVDGAWFVAGTR